MSKELQMSIIKKIQSAGGDTAVETFLSSEGQDLPAIKLTDKELEILGGGGFWSNIGDGFAGAWDIISNGHWENE
ncbi:MAG: hypothetical protein JKY86_01190 [Gammaproteobacteria bacterium]|nr:hypothetical protein [Gammaproteobacteria bacterium]